MMLYKYRDDSQFTDRIFTDNEVWLATASQLNDPFECSITKIAASYINEQVLKAKQAQLLGFVMELEKTFNANLSFFGLSDNAMRNLRNRLKKARNDFPAAYETYRKFVTNVGHTHSVPEDTFSNFDDQLNAAGIFSLSEPPDDQLMWAHYGDQSKGLAIGFKKTSDNTLGNNEKCLPVNYCDTLPAFSGGFNQRVSTFRTENGLENRSSISPSDPTFRLAISTKPTCWQYEREWRYIEETGGAFPRPAPIAEIIFGLLATESTIEKYTDLAAHHLTNTVNLFKIERIEDANQIKIVPLLTDT